MPCTWHSIIMLYVLDSPLCRTYYIWHSTTLCYTRHSIMSYITWHSVLPYFIPDSLSCLIILDTPSYHIIPDLCHATLHLTFRHAVLHRTPCCNILHLTPRRAANIFSHFIVPLEFLPWKIRVAFIGESQLRQSRATQLTLHGGGGGVCVCERERVCVCMYVCVCLCLSLCGSLSLPLSLSLSLFPWSAEFWHGLQDLHRAYLIFLLAYTHGVPRFIGLSKGL